TPCSDGIPCSCSLLHADLKTGRCDLLPNNDVCAEGYCTSDFYQADCAQTYCLSVGDRACPTGSACCGSRVGCINLSIDNVNCGQCGHTCPPGMYCSGGACQRFSAPCVSPSAID